MSIEKAKEETWGRRETKAVQSVSGLVDFIHVDKDQVNTCFYFRMTLPYLATYLRSGQKSGLAGDWLLTQPVNRERLCAVATEPSWEGWGHLQEDVERLLWDVMAPRKHFPDRVAGGEAHHHNQKKQGTAKLQSIWKKK